MDHKKNQHSRRSKRQNKIAEDNYWDCSVCTYRNNAEAFKCLMCDVRKGTSTRKPRINPQLVAQQVAQQYTQSLPKVKKDSTPGSIASSSTTSTTTSTPVTNSTTTVTTTQIAQAIPISTAIPVSTVAATLSTATITTAMTTAPLTITTNSIHAASSKVELDMALAPANKSEKRYSSTVDGKSSSTRRLRPKLKNVDRSSAEHKAVTVNNVTVIITEFQPKRHYSSSSDHSGHHNSSSGSTASGFNHSSGGRNGGGGGGGGGSTSGVGTFQIDGNAAENGLHPDLSHKHQRVSL